MDKDWIERDRLLTEIHTSVKHMATEMGKQSASFDIHVINDSVQFKSLKKRIFWLTMAVVVIGFTIGGPSLAFMFVK